MVLPLITHTIRGRTVKFILMLYKTIQGIDVPAIGVGTYLLHDDECRKAVQMALDIGYRHIDTAQMYNNEQDVGQAIHSSSVAREELYLTTKIWHTNLAPDQVLQSTEQSLRKLDTDYVDLLLIHWPNNHFDLDKTIEAMLVLRDQGKAINIGVSNFPLSLLQQANDELQAPIFCEQIEFHPFLGQQDILNYAIENDIMLTAYAPLGQGEAINNDTLKEIGKHYNKSASQIALRWLIEHENVAAIPKSSSQKHLEENLDIFDFKLHEEDFRRIDDLDKSQRIVNPPFAPEW